jgi:dihydropyrimidinase
VSAEPDLSKSDYSVYEGWTFTGWPVMTIRRGEVIGENGRIVGQAGSGRLISRAAWRE